MSKKVKINKSKTKTEYRMNTRSQNKQKSPELNKAEIQ